MPSLLSSSPGLHTTRARLLLATLAILTTLFIFSNVFPSAHDSTLSSFLPLSRSLSRSGSSPEQAPFAAARPAELVRVVPPTGSARKSHTEWRLSEEHAWLPSKKRERLMFATSATHDYESFTSFLHTLSTLMPATNIRTYHPSASEPFPFGFTDVFNQLSLPDNLRELKNPADFLEDAAKTNLYSGPDSWGMKADLIILGSCEVDMPHWGPGLLQQWKSRPKSERFNLVCLVHDAADMHWLQEGAGAEFVREGALRMIVESESVRRAVMYILSLWSDERPTHQVGFDYVPVYSHLPLLPLKLEPKHHHSDILTQAMVASFSDDNDGSRDFLGLLTDLHEELRTDPLPWGYLAPSESEPTYTPHPRVPSFTLHFITHSNLDSLPIPAELRHVVQIHANLSAYHYYAAAATYMDIVIPALGTAKTADHNLHAHSSIPLSIMCETPILTTHHLSKSHPSLYAIPNIRRPSYLREIEAIKVLRAGSSYVPATSTRPGSLPPGVREEIVQMVERGWRYSPEGWREGRSRLDERAKEVGQRILAGM